MMKKPVLLLMIALFLAGCAVGPDYRRPAIDVPQAYRYGDGQGTSEAADSEWWKQFNDPVLDQFIAEALLNNKNVRIAAANVERAAGVLTTTRSAFFPQITYNGTAERTQVSKNSLTVPTQNPYNNYQALGGASWEIDLWGRIRRLTESARATLYATMEARRGIVLSLTAEVASSYIQLRALDDQLVIARDTLKTYKESVRIFELQNKYGQVSGMTVEQARSQYETAASQIPQIEVQIAQTENALCILLGRNPGPVERGLKLSEFKAPPVPAGLPSELLERRPDILQAEQNLIAANAQIGAAKAQFFPRISLTGNAGWTSEDLSNLFIGPSAAWNYAGTVTGPIFTGGGLLGQLTQARAQQQAALFAYQQAIQNAFADTENALISRQKVQEQFAAEQKKVAAYKEYARLAGLQYNGGYTPYLTVLNAQQQLFPAELSAAQTNATVLISVVNLYKAMGGGWIEKADRLTRGPQESEEKKEEKEKKEEAVQKE